jgi:tRNA pseudouridine38-40 synthase
MRYFCQLQYNGTRFNGWQRQPNATSIQQVIEEKMTILLKTNIEILGCGRTDTGVHAADYYFHFDAENLDVDFFTYKLNQLVGNDIFIKKTMLLHEDAHARFDATKRSYTYFITLEKDPFCTETKWFYYGKKIDKDVMQSVAILLQEYTQFAPFCKSSSQNLTNRCTIYQSEWEFGENYMQYHITADRFLRGMVRLIVGACINAGLHQISIDDVKYAMENQVLLKKSYSVPPNGLFLTKINYPYI